MKLKVICRNCDRILSWDPAQEVHICPYCNSELTIKDVRMNPTELKKYQEWKKKHKTEIARRIREKETTPPAARTATPPKSAEPAYPVIRPPETDDSDIMGRFLIKKGKTKYGTIELTNPDYMILKLSFWSMGPQQKYLTKVLVRQIHQFLRETGFELERR